MSRTHDWKLHKVVEGDTLSELSVTYGVSIEDLVTINKIADRNLILIDQVLMIYPYYTIQDGDTLTWVARDFQTTVDVLIDLNPQLRANPDLIYPGQVVRIPATGAASTPAPQGGVIADTTASELASSTGDEGSAEPEDEPLSEKTVNAIAPPTYQNDIVPAHRRHAGPFFLQIGDVQTIIPPSFIQVQRFSGVQKIQGVRTKNSLKTKSGYGTTEIRMTLFFNGPEQINGVEIPSPFPGKKYHMDGLRTLLAQFTRTPILPIINEHLNLVHGVYNVVLSGITVQTVADFPGLLQVQLVLHKTATSPYTMRDEAYYAEMVNWPVFRAHIQQALVDLEDPNSTRTHLVKIDPNDPASWGEVTFFHLDEQFLQVVEEAKNEKGEPLGFDKIKDPPMTAVATPDLHLQQLVVSLGNTFVPLQTQMVDTPSHQYLGSMDRTVIMQFLTTNETTVKNLRDLYEASNRVAIHHHDRFVSGYIQVLSPMVQLFGSRHFMFETLHTETKEGAPGLYEITMSLVSFDKTQRNEEALKGLNHGIRDGDELTKHLETIMKGDNNYIDHTILVERALNRMELYPDLELPTYKELEGWVAAIENQRKEHGLPPTGYKIPKVSGVSAIGAVFVDPDFYMMYQGWRPAGLLDVSMLGQAFDRIKSGGTSQGTDSDDVHIPGDILVQGVRGARLIDEGETSESEGTGASTPDDTERFQVTSYMNFPLDSKYPATESEVEGWLQTGLRYPHNASSVLKGTAKAWIKAQDISGVNILFLLALAVNESAWGTSQIARDKYNFFGMTAYNDDPYGTAQNWRSLGVEGAIIEGCKWVAKHFIYNGKKSIYEIQHTGKPYAQLDNGMPNPEWEETILRNMQVWVPLGQMIRAVTGSAPKFALDSVGGFSTLSGARDRIGPPGRFTSFNLSGDFSQLPKDFFENAKPMVSVLPEDDLDIAPNAEVPKDTEKLLAQMCQDMVRYNPRGRMLRAFPTYLLLFVDEGIWADGRRLWTNYYAYHSLLSVSVVREAENPVDVAYVELTNIYGDLSRNDQIPEEALPNGMVDQFMAMMRALRPALTDKMIEYRRRMVDSANVKAGARVHIRLGYGSTASELPITFNGIVAEIGVSDTISMVCQGDGVELTQVMTEFNPEDSTGGIMPSALSTFGHEPQEIIRNIMTERGTGFRWFNWAGENSPYGIAHFGLVQKEEGSTLTFLTGAGAGLVTGAVGGFFIGGPIGAAIGAVGGAAAGGTLSSSDNMDVWPSWYWKRTWDVVKNIHSSAAELYVEDDSVKKSWIDWLAEWTWFDKEKNIKLYLGGKAPWDLFNTIAKSTPDYLVAVHPHQFRSTLYFGLPQMSLRYGYVRRKAGPSRDHFNFGEMHKPFTQFHVLTSYTDLLGNEVRASGERLITNCVAVYNENGDYKQVAVQKADSTIKPEMQRTTTVDTGLLQNAYFPIPWDDELLRFTGIYKNGYNHAVHVARSHIQSSFRQMYQGELVVFGSPEIKPHDLFYLNDSYTKMFGTAQVGRVVHSLSPDTGFITTIKPDLVVSRKESPWAEMMAGLTARGVAISGTILKAIIAWRQYQALKTPWHTLLVSGVRQGLSLGAKIGVGADRAWRTIRGTYRIIKAGENWWDAIKYTGRIVSGVGGVWTLGASWVMWEVAIWAAERLASAFIEWLESQNVIQIFPLWYKDRPYVAGIDGWQHLIPGLPDPEYYPNSLPPKTRMAMGMAPAASSLPANQRLDMGTLGSSSSREEQYSKARSDAKAHQTGTRGVKYPEPTQGGKGGDGVNPEVYNPGNTKGWVLPIDRGRFTITTYYGKDVLRGKERIHYGWDMGAAEGTPVMAMKAGKVVVAQNDFTPGVSYGRYIIIEHEGGIFTLYGHLSRIEVEKGQSVSTGQVIGLVGNTGNSTGPHLHIEFKPSANGLGMDPANYFPGMR